MRSITLVTCRLSCSRNFGVPTCELWLLMFVASMGGPGYGILAYSLIWHQKYDQITTKGSCEENYGV